MLNKLSSLLIFSIYLIGAIFFQPTVVKGAEHPITLEISTDKEKYQEDEEVIYQIELMNHSVLEASDLIISVDIPKGLEVIEADHVEDGRLILEIDHLAGLESTSVEFTTRLANDYSLLKYIVIFALLVGGIVLATIIFRRKRAAKAVILMLIATGLFANPAVKIDAEGNSYRLTKESQVVIGESSYDFVITLEVLNPEEIALTGDWGMDEDDTLHWELSWTPVGDSFSYHIYRSYTNEDDDFELVAKNISDNYVATDFDMNGETYYYIELVNENIQSNILKVDGTVDTDEDGLSDPLEFVLGTDPLEVDTDGDGLPDGYEVYHSLTDPLVEDSDQNGVNDANEDPDDDGLTNLEEFEHGTEPHNSDSDFDGWADGYELEQGTDPLQSDTDQDGVIDSLEESFGFDPLNPDTNGDGVLDGDELVSYTTETDEIERDPYVNPEVTIKSPASDVTTTTITNIEGTNWFLSDDIPGYLGAPFDFNTEIDFDQAEMTFVYDGSIVTDEFRPEIFYYNEEMQRLERLEDQAHDPDNHSVTATVEHFSVYLLLNGVIWDAVWEKKMRRPDEFDPDDSVNIDVVFSIDSSGSMSDNDPDDLRKKASKAFAGKLRDGDRAGVVDFDDYGTLNSALTTDKLEINAAIDLVDNNGGTDLYRGITTAVDEIVDNGVKDHLKFIVFLTDGEGRWDDVAIDYANEQDVTIYTIGLGSGVDKKLLERIATSTGGQYYYADEADSLEGIFDQSADGIIGCLRDRDCDGIPDHLEKGGMRLGNGKTIYTDFTLEDTDGDGLLDGEEVTTLYNDENKPYYIIHSDPTLKDTDKDGIMDSHEAIEDRMIYNVSDRTLTHVSNLAYVNLWSQRNKKIGVAKRIGNKKHLDEVKDEMADWTIIKANNGGSISAGFGGVAVKKGHDIVIGYRGTQVELSDQLLLDLAADLNILLFGNNIQNVIAKRFAANIVLSYPNANVYVTGHSLGGFLAQGVSYNMLEKELHNVYSINTSNATAVKETLADGSYFKKGVTFNAAPFFNVTYANGPGLSTAIIPLENFNSNKYDDKVYNYSIKGDFLQRFVNLEHAQKFGQVVPSFPKNRDGSAHSLVQFYDHFPKLD